MIEKKLKIVAIFMGMISLLYSIYSVYGIIMLLFIDWHFDIRMIFGNPVFTYLWLSPLWIIGLFIASFGLYKGRKWGHIVSNICLILFLIGFVAVHIYDFFPDLFDGTVQVKPGWFVSYHVDLNFETLVSPTLVTMLIIVLNLKPFRRAYH